MGAREGGIVGLAVAIAIFAVLQFAEEAQRSAPGDPRIRKILRARHVGAAFLDAGEGEELAHRGALPHHHGRHRCIPGPGERGADPGEQREQGDPARRLHPLAEADDMAAGNMAQFVRDHALDLVGTVRRLDQAGMDIDRLPPRHEGVDAGIVDEDDVDVSGLQPRRLDQRFRNVAQERLGLRIAQDRLGGDRLGARKRESDEGEQEGKSAHCGPASGFRPEPELKPAVPHTSSPASGHPHDRR